MIRLIKNELYKIFHKKAIFIFAIMMAALSIGWNYLEKVIEDDVTILVGTTGDFYPSSEKDNYYQLYYLPAVEEKNLTSQSSKEEFSEAKSYYDTYALIDEYVKGDSESPIFYYITNNIYNVIVEMNTAYYVDNDDETYNNLKLEYDELVNKIENYDWKESITEEKTKLETQIKTLEDETELSNDSKLTLAGLKVSLEELNYRLEHNIPYSYSTESTELSYLYNLISNYVTYDKETLSKEGETTNSYYQEIEAYYNIAKYKIEHNYIDESTVMEKSGSKVCENITSFYNLASLFLVLFLIIQFSNILSEEFNKGTIKQLLVRPYKRNKIITSKILAVLISFFALLIYYLLFETIIGIIEDKGISGLFNNALIYNYNTQTVHTINIFAYWLIETLAYMPYFLILGFLSLLISVISTNGMLSVFGAYSVQIISSLISFPEKIAYLIPSNCWNLNDLLFGAPTGIKYQTLTNAIIVDVVTIIILLVLSHLVFKKKDIVNQ